MKPENIPIDGKDYYAWPYEEQTKIKHRVLQTYFKIWVAKLGKYSNTLFMDCHGGCGAYIDLSSDEVCYGSSILVDKIAAEVNQNRLNRNYICVCEQEKETFLNLQKVWIDQNCSQYCRFKNEDFNISLKDKKLNQFYHTHPSLFFVDPFGYNLKMDNLSDLLVHKGNEIIINFMYDYMNRFLGRQELVAQLTNYFGCDDWKNALKLHNNDREMFLVELYKNNLKRVTGAKFVFAYRLSYPDRNQTYYYLFHATNDIQGITHMKNAFASINNGRVEYVGKRQNNISLFDLTSFKTADLASNVLSRFSKQTITFDDLWQQIVEDIPYLEKDLSEAIADLEMENKLKVKRITSKRCSYKGQDEITFGELE